MSTFRAYLVTPPVDSRRPRTWGTVATEAGRLARELGGDAQTVELPATKTGLIPFLNSLESEHAGELERLTSAEQVEPDKPIEGRFWEQGPKTKEPPRYSPKFIGEHGRVEFVPIAVSAAIAASYGACPKCARTWAAQVLAGIASADRSTLETIAGAIQQRLAVAGELEGAE
jgi:hypothetical protein